MAMNPMQRKIRNSFLFGFLVAVIVAAIVVGLLFMKIKGLNDEISAAREKEKIAMTDVYTVSQAVKENESIRYVSTIQIATEKVPANAITDANLGEYLDENDEYQMVAKVNIAPNVPLTTDMVEKSAEASSYRLVEFSMISLPSKLVTGDYIDIRLAISDIRTEIADYIVLSKIQVEEATSNTIWLKVSESQLQLLNNAIVESYIIEGSKIYATQYVNPAQAPLNATYVPNEYIAGLIKANAWTDADNDIANKRDDVSVRTYIGSILEELDNGEITSKVQEGFTTEKTTIQAARDALLGDMGY